MNIFRLNLLFPSDTAPGFVRAKPYLLMNTFQPKLKILPGYFIGRAKQENGRQIYELLQRTGGLPSFVAKAKTAAFFTAKNPAQTRALVISDRYGINAEVVPVEKVYSAGLAIVEVKGELQLRAFPMDQFGEPADLNYPVHWYSPFTNQAARISGYHNLAKLLIARGTALMEEGNKLRAIANRFHLEQIQKSAEGLAF